MVDKKTKQLIHDYLQGRASTARERKLKRRLRDPEVWDYFEQLKEAYTWVDEIRVDARRKGVGFSFVEKNETSPEEEKKLNDESLAFAKKLEYDFKKRQELIRGFVKLAAAAVILVGLIFVYNLFKNRDTGDLYTQFYEKHEFIINRSANENRLNIMRAKTLYNSYEYDAAISIVKELRSVPEFHIEANFIYGLCLQEIKQYQDALATFKELLDSDPPGYDRLLSLSAWYGSLAAIAMDNYVEALQLLNQAKSYEGSYPAIKDFDQLRVKLKKQMEK